MRNLKRSFGPVENPFKDGRPRWHMARWSPKLRLAFVRVLRRVKFAAAQRRVGRP